MKININKRDIKLILIAVAAGLVLGWVFFYSSSNNATRNHNHELETETSETIYTCSMHPQIKQNKPGLCPICAMDLIPMENIKSEDEHVNLNEIQMSASAMALAAVQTTIVKKGIPEKEIQLLGKVKADERNISTLTARFGGRIEKLNINYTGQKVHKGEKLGSIYSPELITAQRELLESLKYKITNPSFYKASRGKLKLWDLTEQQIDEIETHGEIKTFFDIQSPISGTVTKKQVSIGDYVKEGSPLFEVINLSNIWVMFEAYESDLPWIKKGDLIEFTLQSIPGKQFKEKIAFIDPFIDAQKRVAQIRVELNNLNGHHKPEMFAVGILKSTIKHSVKEILIPKTSILWTGKRAVVYVKVPDREMSSFIYREIVLGPEAGNFYVVSEGLLEGEEIATNGVFKIDAAAQLSGKLSMMNRNDNEILIEHNHGVALNGKNHGHAEHNPTNVNLKQETFFVSGNCEMCKSTIELTVKSLPGIGVANWDLKTKELNVSFDDQKSSLSDIHKAIAKSGYDTKLEKATIEAYDKLPACCKYPRIIEIPTKPNAQHEMNR
ncbi:MAG: efflux RND transporter periplasmic adaptor subunit [Salinivirgaceae bacterium]|nr:efflux RND transporter periplasmic adaptor subunit [Salinivirgaceae bacterium]